MATITFRAKAEEMPNGQYLLRVPVFERRHCDMATFRTHPKHGGYANSDLFPAVLRRIRREMFGDSGCLFSSRSYPGVSVSPGFLHTVTITV